MKVDEKLKLDNFKAQYTSILGNIGIANKELESVLAEKSKVTAVLEKAKEDLALIEAEYETVQQNIAEAHAEASESLEALAKKRSTEEKDLQETKDNYTTLVTGLRSEYSWLMERIVKLTPYNNSLVKENGVLKTAQAELSKSIESLKESIARLETQRETLLRNNNEAIDAHELQMAKAQKELFEVNEKIADTSSKIIEVDSYLKHRESILTRREKDVEVVTNRLRKLYQEVRPGVGLKI